jgi:hypothetical protein
MDLKDAIAYPCCGTDGHPLDGKGLARAMTIISPGQVCSRQVEQTASF